MLNGPSTELVETCSG